MLEMHPHDAVVFSFFLVPWLIRSPAFLLDSGLFG
jgi:hypothetical protein